MEQPLHGGNVSGAVVRVGPTVRKPAGPWTPAVDSLLSHLEAAGFAGAPRPLGGDEQDRQILEYIEGPMAIDSPPLDGEGLHRVGRLIRELHDHTENFAPPPDARWNVAIQPGRHELICHHDLAPWNLVLGQDRWVFIDWDGAGPGFRLWDLAYAVTGFVPLHAQGDPAADAPRVRALADGYGLNAAQRRELPRLIAVRTRAMFNLLRDSWGPAAAYIERNLATWARALGLPADRAVPALRWGSW